MVVQNHHYFFFEGFRLFHAHSGSVCLAGVIGNEESVAAPVFECHTAGGLA